MVQAPAPGQVMFWVRDLKLKLVQSDVSKVTHVWHKKKLFPQFLFLQIKGHKYKKKR